MVPPPGGRGRNPSSQATPDPSNGGRRSGVEEGAAERLDTGTEPLQRRPAAEVVTFAPTPELTFATPFTTAEAVAVAEGGGGMRRQRR
ncbi:hypothetical protein PR202_gb28174 [Eleusine coracana subsp. coracana]|uniref:Uncharacterized protein n=1 Tax=Eleusine coracana subsp. coracana TaxID=191504 RepID=A0AAV5FWK7_ELECO|nr:hypothetical protein PR202_gb28174 [Eleusine coracana subsp. coracana]